MRTRELSLIEFFLRGRRLGAITEDLADQFYNQSRLIPNSGETFVASVALLGSFANLYSYIPE